MQGGQGRVGPTPRVKPRKLSKKPASGSKNAVPLNGPIERFRFVVGPASSPIVTPPKTSPLKLTPPPGLPVEVNPLNRTLISVIEFTVIARATPALNSPPNRSRSALNPKPP